MTTRPLALAAFASVLFASSAAMADEPATSSVPSATPVAPVVSAPAPASPAPTATEAPEVEEGTAPVAPAAPAAPLSRVGTSDEPTEVTQTTEATEIRTMPGARYGLEILLADGLALAVAGASIKFEQPGFAVLSLTTYVMAPPIVHFIHGRPGRAAASFGLRVGSPAVGMVTGIAMSCVLGACSGRGDFAGYGAVIGGIAGIGAGAIAAMVVDAVVLAREPDVKVRVPRGWDGKPRIAPTVSALPGGGAVGVGGSF